MNRRVILVELNYQVTPIEVRERVSSGKDQVRQALHGCLGQHVFIISTCHRFSMLAYVNHEDQVIGPLRSLFPTLQLDHLLVCKDQTAIQHWFATACGLHSRTLGEHEILGQIKNAYGKMKDMPAELNELIKRAIHTGRRARTETAIGRYATSLTSVTKDQIIRHVPETKRTKVMVFGTGEMSRLILQMLGQYTWDTIYVVSKDKQRAADACSSRDMVPISMDNFSDVVNDCEVVIGATWATEHLLEAGDLATGATRKLLIDLGMPRNFDPQFDREAAVDFYDLATIQHVTDQSRMKRAGETAAVQGIIEEEVRECVKWLAFRPFIAEVKSIRAEIEAVESQTFHAVDQKRPGMDQIERKKLQYKLRGIAQRHFSQIITVLKSDQCNLHKVTNKLEILHSLYLSMDLIKDDLTHIQTTEKNIVVI